MQIIRPFSACDRCARRLAAVVAAWVCLSLISNLSRAADAPSPALVLQELQSFNQWGSVLYIAAHPDDENTQLISYLARGRNYRTAYLSITRGDGGQNVLGPEFGPELGAIRTEELLAARSLDGGRQFFTRAIDFGFSKDYRQTLEIWDRQEVLSDIVRVIRTFRPDVIVTRFTTVPGNTHGHHTASAVLGLEAFKLAGDPSAFPDQLKDLSVWQPKRVFSNGFAVGFGPRGGGNGAATRNDQQVVRMSINGADPVSGLTFADLAARSRSMHKTQGFGNFAGRGGSGARAEAFQLLDGEPAKGDIMDGVDTTWGRINGGPDIGKMTDDLIAKFDSQNLPANVPALLAIKAKADALADDPIVDEKRKGLDLMIQQCLGLDVQTTLQNARVVPGETLTLHHVVNLHGDVPVKWLSIRYPSVGQELLNTIALPKDQPVALDSDQTLPIKTPLSQPYWLREDGTRGMFRVDDATLIGRPMNPPVFPIEDVFEVGGQKLVIADEPVQMMPGATAATAQRKIDVIPPVSIRFASSVQLFAPGATKEVGIDLIAHRPASAGTIQLDVPSGWSVTPDSQPFNLTSADQRSRFTFKVTAPAQATTANIGAHVTIDGSQYGNDQIEINYSHVPPILMQSVARLKATSVEIAIRGQHVGYLSGAGDNVADALSQMGYSVTQLSGADLTAEKLHGLDAVVTGVRAFAVRKDLTPANMQALTDFVQAGGNVIVQYVRPESGVQSIRLGPYQLHLSTDRVTDPNSAMTFLVPDHPAVNSPNKITAADFQGWVQERGTYFPNQWDEHFVPIFACNDAGEQLLKGALLIAPYGKGNFIYTGLVFFRQLPAGVPGAYRLMANLVSLGK